MSKYYAPCFYRIDIVVIPSHTELPWENWDKPEQIKAEIYKYSDAKGAFTMD